MTSKIDSSLNNQKLPKPPERFCEKCGGRLQSCGIRRSARRYRCFSCKFEAKSILLSPEEIEFYTKRDKGIGNASLTERYEEVRGIENDRNPFCILPQYDPKFCKAELKNPRVEQKYGEARGYRNFEEEAKRTREFLRKARIAEEDKHLLAIDKRVETDLANKLIWKE